MSAREPSADESAQVASDDDEATLKMRLSVLEEQNARLRNAYGEVKRTRHRRTAFGLLALGLLATGGGLVFPNSRNVLFALGGTGLFASVLTYYLTPERFIAASVGEKVYSALVESRTELTAELGLADVSVYVPPADEGRSVRLFVPEYTDYDLPDDVERTFVTADGRSRGVAFAPTGAGLYEEFEHALAIPLGERPGELAEQVADAVVEQFELAAAVRTDLDESGGRAIFEVADSAFGRVDRFDHPIPSLAAVGLARAVGRPVEVETAPAADDSRGEFLITCRWEPDDRIDDAAPTSESERSSE